MVIFTKCYCRSFEQANYFAWSYIVQIRSWFYSERNKKEEKRPCLYFFEGVKEAGIKRPGWGYLLCVHPNGIFLLLGLVTLF